MDPPSFTESLQGSVFDVQEPLPTYTGSTTRQSTEHRYTIGKPTHPWLALILPSKANKPDDLPYFFGHAPIAGRVELDLVEPEYFVGLEIQVSLQSMRLCSLRS